MGNSKIINLPDKSFSKAKFQQTLLKIQRQKNIFQNASKHLTKIVKKNIYYLLDGIPCSGSAIDEF